MPRVARLGRALVQLFWLALAFVSAVVAVGMLIQASVGPDRGVVRLVFAGAGLVLLAASYLTYRAHAGDRM
ncbi:MAG TPA: hypothetical protein VEC15_03535 [Actinomycetota bacterium]|nr:hypothetical protein [Actinomycetota bacterium]